MIIWISSLGSLLIGWGWSGSGSWVVLRVLSLFAKFVARSSM